MATTLKLNKKGNRAKGFVKTPTDMVPYQSQPSKLFVGTVGTIAALGAMHLLTSRHEQRKQAYKAKQAPHRVTIVEHHQGVRL